MIEWSSFEKLYSRDSFIRQGIIAFLFYDVAKEKRLFKMNKTFSELFVEDKNSPKYTACISIILFNEFQRCKLIYTEKIATKACCWHKDIEYFEVLDDYTPRPNNKTGHCLYLIYSYTSYYPPEPYPLRKPLIEEMCVMADCTGI
jgi:hypothetical protein